MFVSRVETMRQEIAAGGIDPEEMPSQEEWDQWYIIPRFYLNSASHISLQATCVRPYVPTIDTPLALPFPICQNGLCVEYSPRKCS